MNEKPMCPHCPGSALRRSQHKGLKDAVMSLFGRRPMRCHECKKRYYIRTSALPEKSESRDKS